LRYVGATAGRAENKSGNAWPGLLAVVASLAIFLIWVGRGISGSARILRGSCDARIRLARFGETIHRPQPLLFYLPHLLHKFAPWSVLMIGIAAVVSDRETGVCAAVSRNVSGNFLAALLERWWLIVMSLIHQSASIEFSL